MTWTDVELDDPDFFPRSGHPKFKPEPTHFVLAEIKANYQPVDTSRRARLDYLQSIPELCARYPIWADKVSRLRSMATAIRRAKTDPHPSDLKKVQFMNRLDVFVAIGESADDVGPSALGRRFKAKVPLPIWKALCRRELPVPYYFDLLLVEGLYERFYQEPFMTEAEWSLFG